MPSTDEPSGKEVNFMDREQAIGFRWLQASGLGWMSTGQAMARCGLIALSSHLSIWEVKMMMDDW